MTEGSIHNFRAHAMNHYRKVSTAAIFKKRSIQRMLLSLFGYRFLHALLLSAAIDPTYKRVISAIQKYFTYSCPEPAPEFFNACFKSVLAIYVHIS